MSYEPTLTAYNSSPAGPGVSVAFGTLPPGTTAVDVFRIAGGRTLLVRGGARAAAFGSWLGFDNEAPFGIPSTYFALAYDNDGNTIAYTGAAAITLNSTVTWIHNPLNPAGSIPVRTAAETGAQVTGQIDGNVYYPVGRAAGVAITGQRRGIASVPLVVYTQDAAAAAELDAMFGGITGDLTLPPFLCVRFASQFRVPLPRPLFLVVNSPTRAPVNHLAGGVLTAWNLNGAEVDPPTPALSQGLLARADLDAYYPSRAARDAAYASRLAADTDYNLAGYGS